MYEKVNRNSLGQQLRKRERLVHASTRIVPEHKITDKDGVEHIIPAKSFSLHRENPLRSEKREAKRNA